MRTFTFMFFLTLGSLFLQGQTHKMLSYKFNSTLNESKGIGPTLVLLDSAGMFVTDTLNKLDGKTKIVYHFKKNCGFQFNNALAGNFLDSTYTIELYFKFDDLNRWRRVIDWKNRTTDDGAYILSGEVSFYDYSTSDTVTVASDVYIHYLVTRDGLTKDLKMYSDAIRVVQFTDVDNEGVIDTSHVINFFRDDLQVPDEASSGAVTLLNIYNYVLDSATVKHKFDSLQNVLFAVREPWNNKAPIRVYPNPAYDNLNISLGQAFTNEQVTVSLITSTGSLVYNRSYPAANSYRINLKTLTLPNGIYMVKVESANQIYYQKVVILR
jgi:hypothetical protein